MEFNFHVQDPLDASTKYLYEAIVEQLGREEVDLWKGMYSFATGDGVRSLFGEDPSASEFITRGSVDLLIGIDAITNVSALEQLASLDREHPSFQARVFKSPGGTLFHPKVSSFYDFDNHRVTVILGSGNLTPGGLRGNTETYAVISGSLDEMASLASWDAFIGRRVDEIRVIDEDALRRAMANQAALARRRPRIPDEEVEIEELAEAADEGDERQYRVLAAVIPRAGDRWHQIHFNADVVERFIQMRSNSEQRAFLRSVNSDGQLGPEEQRPLVFSEINKNYKIEMSSRRDHDYPDDAPPLLVMKELGARIFHYMILFPGEDGYRQIESFIDERPAVGRGSPRVISTLEDLLSEWPDSPLA